MDTTPSVFDSGQTDKFRRCDALGTNVITTGYLEPIMRYHTTPQPKIASFVFHLSHSYPSV